MDGAGESVLSPHPPDGPRPVTTTSRVTYRAGGAGVVRRHDASGTPMRVTKQRMTDPVDAEDSIPNTAGRSDPTWMMGAASPDHTNPGSPEGALRSQPVCAACCAAPRARWGLSS